MQTRLGRVFGLLTVVSRVADGEYLCVCACGNKKTARWENLRRGFTKSCGCLRGPVAPSEKRSHSRPGVKQHPLYETWRTMIRRCTDPKNARYADYGARGIGVCESWRSDFWAFADYVGPKPSPAHTLDRIDNGGNYEPGNCRWASPDEQANNKRSTQVVRFKGDRVSVAKLLKSFGLRRPTGSAGLTPAEVVAKAYVSRQWWAKQQRGERADWSRITPKLLSEVAKRLKIEDV